MPYQKLYDKGGQFIVLIRPNPIKYQTIKSDQRSLPVIDGGCLYMSNYLLEKGK